MKQYRVCLKGYRDEGSGFSTLRDAEITLGKISEENRSNYEVQERDFTPPVPAEWGSWKPVSSDCAPPKE